MKPESATERGTIGEDRTARSTRGPLVRVAVLVVLACVSWSLSSIAGPKPRPASPAAQPSGTPSAIPSAPPPVPAAQPAPAPSAEPSADAKKDQARAHFDTAISLFEQEAWDAALVEFDRSRELFPTRAATKDAALCLRKLGRFDEALLTFEGLLRDFPNLPDADKSLATKEIDALKALVGSIELLGADEGALVVIDGKPRGTAPLAAVRVAAGTHAVRVTKSGFLPFEVQLEIGGAQARKVRVKLELLAKGGRLRVAESKGAQADVLVDGVPVGKAPWEGALPLGDHSVALQSEGSLGTQPVVAPVNLDQLTALNLTLEALDARLRVQPTPANASVAVDGVTVGRGVWEARVRVGNHRIEVVADGFVAQRRDLPLAKDETKLFTVALERDLTSPMWRSPPRFFIELDGGPSLAAALGSDVMAACTSPCTRSLPLGALVRARGGYRLSAGLGFSLDAGYAFVSQSAKGRATTLKPVGLSEDAGVVDDDLTFRGAVLGASAGYYGRGKLPLTFRLGGGVLIGSTTDTRRGDFTTGSHLGHPPSTPFTVDRTEVATARYAYAAPEARVGYHVSDRVDVTAGIEAMLLFGLTVPAWTDASPVLAATDGVATFGSQSLLGKTVVIVTPSVGVHAEF